MIIAVTGGTGFIGQYFLRALPAEHSAVILSERTDFSGLYHRENIRYRTVSYSEDDFCPILEGCDCLVHLGSARSDPETEKAFSNYFPSIAFSEKVFSAAQRLGIRNAVNISSISVYGGDMNSPYRESDRIHPISYYGLAKYCVEEIAKRCNEKYDMCIKSLRVAQVLGLGEREGYMPSIFLKHCLNQEKLSVFGTGSAGKEYIYVKDVAAGIISACEHESEKGIFNLGSGIYTTNLELAQTFCDVFQNKSGFELLPERAETSLLYRMDVSETARRLGFTARYQICDALQDIRNSIERKMDSSWTVRKKS